MNPGDNSELFDTKLGFGEHKPEAISLLKKTIDILNHFEINHFLISGTLLGCVRHQDFIPWDDDIDLLVDSSILKKIDSIVSINKELSFFFKDKQDSLKICFKNGIEVKDNNWSEYSIRGSEEKYNWPFIDLFIYESGPGLHACGNYGEFSVNGVSRKVFLPFSGPCKGSFRFIKKEKMVFFHNNWKIDKFFPAQKVNFLGVDVNIPNDPNYFLSRNFGSDYMKVLKSSSRVHREDLENKNIVTIKYDDWKRN